MEPWHLKSEDSRTADAIETFIIFCEGEVTEPLYFNYFETPIIKVNTIGNFKSKLIHVKKAIEYCFKEQFIIYKGKDPIIGTGNLHLWCVYDRDLDRTTPEKELSTNLEFDLSIRTADNESLEVAWSNDSFELWILLHFEEVDYKSPSSQNREYYYARLTEIMKNVAEPNEELKRITRIANFNYKDHLKSKNNFREIVRKEMIPQTAKAISRANELLKYFMENENPFHKRSPCTLVHHLVNELITKGGKVI